MSVADHDIITQRYFFPRRTSPPAPTRVDVGAAELACHHADRGHGLTVLHFHGNGEVVADYVPGLADGFDDLGANAFFAEYRGYGGSTGTPRLGAMLDDVSPVCDAVGVPDEQIVVFGRSIGSIYAIELAKRRPDIAGLVLESGIADVLERILLRATPAELGTTREEMEREFGELFDHEQKLGEFGGPTLVLHAENDHLVDKSHAERNARWAGGKSELVIFPRGDHNSIFHVNRDAYLERLGAFLDSVA
ncbi:MAG: alpha/beta hydrolase [Myxococcota bacterium]